MTETAATVRSIWRLRGLLALLFVAIAIPSALLVLTTWRQLRFEALHQARSEAQVLAERIDRALQQRIDVEEGRAAADYGYTRIGGAVDADSNLVERSPLSALPTATDWPGLLGWFQVDAEGNFSTPLLPDAQTPAPVEADQLESRQQVAGKLREVLVSNALIEPAGSKGKRDVPVPGYAATKAEQRSGFDELSSRQQVLDNVLARVDELPFQQEAQKQIKAPEQAVARGRDRADSVLDSAMSGTTETGAQTRALRKEQAIELKDLSLADADVRAPLAQVQASALGFFEAEVEPFRFTLLDDGHALLFRTVWRERQRSVQGALLDQHDWLEAALWAPQRQSGLAGRTDLLLAWNEQVIAIEDGSIAATSVAEQRQKAAALRGELLYSHRLRPPLDGLTLLWHLRQLPPAPGATLLTWTAGVLAAVLVVGFGLLYRLALKQIRLARQRQDFVAAVSHELNTPLTSIRMYAEMLKAGWATPDKLQTYYDYILGESERLSRLIGNVLQLSRMERRGHRLERTAQPLSLLIDLLRSRLASPVERAGFQLDWQLPEPAASAGVQLDVDADALLQVFINIVDNALKFAAEHSPRTLTFMVRPAGPVVRFEVRDHGPGVPPGQQRRVFDLFWRGITTASAPGTGIGLAVVQQLVRAHDGCVRLDNAHPGAVVTVELPASTSATLSSTTAAAAGSAGR